MNAGSIVKAKNTCPHACNLEMSYSFDKLVSIVLLFIFLILARLPSAKPALIVPCKNRYLFLPVSRPSEEPDRKSLGFPALINDCDNSIIRSFDS